ncbi:MAG: SDR family NAD(P)-dependent oxidoreductase, partial [Proteobacteria bacterium]|nr:SDR family NAD(P)-dependent oxidoreductase [Pseudomonadota bacterium]
MMDMELAGRRVLITGASQGIGQGLAKAFANEGCRLALVARSADKLDALARNLQAAHGVRVDILALDMTQPGAVEKIMAFAG